MLEPQYMAAPPRRVTAIQHFTMRQTTHNFQLHQERDRKEQQKQKDTEG